MLTPLNSPSSYLLTMVDCENIAGFVQISLEMFIEMGWVLVSLQIVKKVFLGKCFRRDFLLGFWRKGLVVFGKIWPIGVICFPERG